MSESKNSDGDEDPNAGQSTPLVQVTDIKLTHSEIAEIATHINSKSIVENDACPVCGSTANFVNEFEYRIDTRKQGDLVGGRYQPLVATICSSCAYVRLFNRNVLKYLIDKQNGLQAGDGNGS